MTGRPHGWRRYQHDRCRCFTCRIGKAEYRRRCEARLLDGYVDATPAREHVAALREAGWGSRRLESTAGVARSTLRRLLVADVVQAKVSRALLGIPLGPPPPPRRYVPAVAVQRQVQALSAIGWSVSEQARRIGMPQSQLSRTLANASLEPGNAGRVGLLYKALSMSAPPASRWVARVKAGAVRASWFPPLAWDDETIDDPDALPCLLPPVEQVDGDLELLVQHVVAGHPVEATPAVRFEIVRRMPDHKSAEVAQLAGCTVQRVSQIRGTLAARARRAAA